MPDIDSILTAITVDTGRTLDAYRHDLRVLFQWANDNNLEVLAATRAHIEIFRGWLEQTGLAPSTVDRRLSTVCGYYRFAHIDGHIASNPAQYVRRPKVPPTEGRGTDRGHRTLRIIGKGNKPALIPLVPRTARTLDLVKGERTDGPLLRRQDHARLDRRTAHRWIQSTGKRAGLGHVHPHMPRAAFIMADIGRCSWADTGRLSGVVGLDPER
ncbi:MAG: site-specific integrase [Actinomycetia bacterium]|nr:site-specific integrase [Actinomycetes bacterium]